MLIYWNTSKEDKTDVSNKHYGLVIVLVQSAIFKKYHKVQFQHKVEVTVGQNGQEQNSQRNFYSANLPCSISY
jgi:hypothetical protein